MFKPLRLIIHMYNNKMYNSIHYSIKAIYQYWYWGNQFFYIIGLYIRDFIIDKIIIIY